MTLCALLHLDTIADDINSCHGHMLGIFHLPIIQLHIQIALIMDHQITSVLTATLSFGMVRESVPQIAKDQLFTTIATRAVKLAFRRTDPVLNL